MSLVAAIRDYIDFINSTCDSLPLDVGLPSLFVPTLRYILESAKYLVLYLATFQWLRDLIYLPLIVPNLAVSLLREMCYPIEIPVFDFFTFLETPAYRSNSFLVGLLNSLFACLPISASHILSGRRLLVQGIPAGLAAGSGLILGQWWFVVCVVMGIRPLVVPWLALEPFNYMLGLGLLVNTVYRITHERRIRVVRWSDKRELLQYFLISLLLSWCEQTSLFQYLGNLTIDAGTTLLDSFSTASLQQANTFWMEASYVGGLLLGSCLFSTLFGLAALGLRGVWLRWRAVTSSRLTNQLNNFFLVTLIGLSFASVPYYGVDYLLSNRVGFASQDVALDGTVFAPATMEDKTGKMGLLSDNKSFDTDVSTFDRGLYLQQHKPVPQSFEDLNYQGEYAWTKRYGKYTRHLVKRKAPLVWSDLFKRIAESDSLRLSNAQDQSREGRGAKGGRGAPHINEEALGDNAVSPTAGSSPLQTLENDAVKKLSSSFLEATDQWVLSDDPIEDLEPGDGLEEDTSEMAERLSEDNETESQFLSMFETGLSPLFINDIPEASAFEKRLKKRFAENPLYPLLLRIDVDSFLNRQPAMHSLSPTEEEALFEKRNMLGQYYDTLREYNNLQNWEHFQTLYHGSKSFANRVYNQQFKGTLRVVRRLFAMTPSPESEANLLTNEEESAVYGQRGKESNKRGESSSPLGKEVISARDNQHKGRALKFDQPLFYQTKRMSHNVVGSREEDQIDKSSKETLQHHISHAYPSLVAKDRRDPVVNLHEELTPYTQWLPYVSPFVEPTLSRPIYAGWDEELRKLVVTNRSLSRSESLYKDFEPLPLAKREQVRRGSPLEQIAGTDQLTKGIYFTCWPLPNVSPSNGLEKSVGPLKVSDDKSSNLLELDSKALLPGKPLQEVHPQLGFTSATDLRNQKLKETFDSFAQMQDQGSVGGNSWEMAYWPPNLRLLDDKPEPMAYKRGGFFWPGHSALRFHLGPIKK